MNIIYSDYKKSDKDQIIRLFEDFMDYLIGIDPIHRLRRLSGYGELQLKKSLKDVKTKNGKFIVATDDSKLIGFVIGVVLHQTEEEKMEVIPSTMGRIIELYVDSKYRCKGVGTALINKIESYFRVNLCDTIWIEVFEPNFSAHGLYKKLGYNDRSIDLIKSLWFEIGYNFVNSSPQRKRSQSDFNVAGALNVEIME